MVDANVLFSSLLKDSLTRRLIFDKRLVLYSPRFLVKEFAKYRAELQFRSKMDSRDFNKLASLIFSRIRLVSEETILPFVTPAMHLTQDSKEVPYLACALAINAEIWSRDPHLQQQRVKCWNTQEIAEELGYL